MKREQTEKIIMIVTMWAISLATMSLPKRYTGYLTTWEFSIMRGVVAAVIVAAIIWLRGRRIVPLDLKLFVVGALFGIGAPVYYEATIAWDVPPVIMVMATSPILNFLYGRWMGREVSGAAVISLGATLVGVALALQPWQIAFSWLGLGLSLITTISTAIYVEVAKTMPREIYGDSAAFWQAVILGIIACLVGLGKHQLHTPATWSLWGILFGFALFAGAVYFLATFRMIELFAHESVSVIIVSQTPWVVVRAVLILPGTHLVAIQWIGVLVGTLGSCSLVYLLQRAEKAKEPAIELVLI